jgi:hypothetical protein
MTRRETEGDWSPSTPLVEGKQPREDPPDDLHTEPEPGSVSA